MTKSRGILLARKHWSEADDARLRALYPDHTGAEVAAMMGRTTSSVFQRAKKLSIEKSAAFLASDRSGRIQRGKQHPNMIAHRFQAGQAAWNKGAHYNPGGRCAETQFKKGRKPEEARNYQPIGTLRVNADGHLERKVTDDPSLAPVRRWTPVYRLVWEEVHGSIPAGHIVVFKPGQTTARLEEITADRLECITRAENARRNHPRNRSPELAKLVQLKGAITRQVNRIAREAQETA